MVFRFQEGVADESNRRVQRLILRPDEQKKARSRIPMRNN
jgi:hypothetical protein